MDDGWSMYVLKALLRYCPCLTLSCAGLYSSSLFLTSNLVGVYLRWSLWIQLFGSRKERL
jgi:hypothetical protein